MRQKRALVFEKVLRVPITEPDGHTSAPRHARLLDDALINLEFGVRIYRYFEPSRFAIFTKSCVNHFICFRALSA
jgi:hypothetical protein